MRETVISFSQPKAASSKETVTASLDAGTSAGAVTSCAAVLSRSRRRSPPPKKEPKISPRSKSITSPAVSAAEASGAEVGVNAGVAELVVP